MKDNKITDNEIIKALECCINNGDCRECALNPKKGNYGYCTGLAIKSALDLINRQKAEIERLTIRLRKVEHQLDDLCKMHNVIKAEAYKEFADKVDEILKRYAHLHKYADKARSSKEEYADGTPMEMVSVWEVLSLKKWEMCDYETMNILQDNIENIEKARLLSELEKDFMLLKREMVGDAESPSE